jgi:hypothetical protein
VGRQGRLHQRHRLSRDTGPYLRQRDDHGAEHGTGDHARHQPDEQRTATALLHLGIGYDDDIDAATRLLLDAAADHNDILDNPEPTVRVAELADSAILLQSRFWIADPREEFSVTRSEYIRAVSERFDDAGIDLRTTTQHELGGELTVHDTPEEGRPQ